MGMDGMDHGYLMLLRHFAKHVLKQVEQKRNQNGCFLLAAKLKSNPP